MVGLGTQDTLEEAEAFVADLGLTIRMLWDPTYQSWAELGVSLQPSSMLLSPEGALIETWLGGIPEAEVLALASGQTPSGPSPSIRGNFCRYADRYVSAHAAFEAFDTAPKDNRQRVIDDIRFAGNAMAQTSPEELSADTEALAAANRALVAIVVDAELDPGRIDAEASAPLASDRQAALAALAQPVGELCGVALPR